ncbi:hypothetical protein [Mesobacillus zeae]|uniref:Uncharacterized protein n=1 Tax=Mesobacillus zeae TaxID=1917180 RepID=A0A398AXE1_9BACI|nr:hypothetical protein [Mesobacillus zeae]RID82231.1 hypothetical protein D1970_19555 [Mesobacillus zeae]
MAKKTAERIFITIGIRLPCNMTAKRMAAGEKMSVHTAQLISSFEIFSDIPNNPRLNPRMVKE